MDLQQAQTFEALAGTISKIWPIVWTAIGGVISAISGLVGGAVFIRLLDRRVKANETATASMQSKLDAQEERAWARLYHQDGRLIYTTMDDCRRHRDACQKAVCAKVDELKTLYRAAEARDEARHRDIQDALMTFAGKIGK